VKKLFHRLRALVPAVALVSVPIAGMTQAQEKNLILATTTSTQDTGLLDVLIPVFERQTGYFFTIVSVNVSPEKGAAKQAVPSAVVNEHGLVGDAHAGPWHRQVSLLGQEQLATFARTVGEVIEPGELAENLTTRDLDLDQVAPLDRFQIGQVELEVTQIGKTCHGEGCAVFRRVGRCVMPEHGIFCRVLRGGALDVGAAGVLVPRPLRARIITLSDRAHRGDYADQSGPRVQKLLEQVLRPRRWHLHCERSVLPDEAQSLLAALRSAREEGVDAVFTTGGTGVGPRDVTPETVASVCDRLIPGIMEAIRAKYGVSNPRALLSRSIAGVAGQMLIYTLPGSVRAAEEYVQEILLTFEHLLVMLHGLDTH
jgi:molybdenum cofactor synthesis domain-containing protein